MPSAATVASRRRGVGHRERPTESRWVARRSRPIDSCSNLLNALPWDKARHRSKLNKKLNCSPLTAVLPLRHSQLPCLAPPQSSERATTHQESCAKHRISTIQSPSSNVQQRTREQSQKDTNDES